MRVNKKLLKLSELAIADNVKLGLDIGIASCGWGLIDVSTGQILGAGTWGFETLEVSKTRESKAAVRRVARGQRRRLRRRRQRMRDIRKLLHENALLSSPCPAPDIKGRAKPCLDPWQLRAAGLDRLLTGEEFAAVLIHLAKHRGYRSNAKSEKSNDAPKEDRKVLAGLAAIKEKSGRYRTVGEMFAVDADFAAKKRNRDGDYSHTIERKLQEDETSLLFRQQRKFGSKFAANELATAYARLAFEQAPLQGSEKLLGKCPFETDEYRASMQAYSFEKFRFLTKLINTRIDDGSNSGRLLTQEELAKAVNGFGKSSGKISWKALVRLLSLGKTARFVGVSEKAMGNDVARNSKGCAFGSNSLYKVIGEAGWNSLVQTPETLDRIAHVLTFLEDVSEITQRLQGLELEPVLLQAILDGVNEGAFAGFARAGHISCKAARNIIPGLLARQTYDKACALAGYDHSRENIADLETLTNPVAKRATVETLKQVNALVRHFGFRPEKIHIELGRDVGKGSDERGRIDKGIKDRTAAKEKARKDFCNLLNKSVCSKGELERYELWKEQKGECMYCYPLKRLRLEDLCDTTNACQVDHILPRSLSHDNSWHNKALCCTKCNQDKKRRTPYQWFGSDAARWDAFECRVKAMHNDKRIKGFKIRNLLLKNFEERQEGFIDRNLNDTRFAARVIQNELQNLYTDEEKTARRIFARAGAITATLRHIWGLKRLKLLPSQAGKKKQRVEDERHHAVDALVLAACSERLLNDLTIAMQKQEEQYGDAIKHIDFPPPWPGFADDVRVAHEKAPVARSENRRARGAGHMATVRKIREEDGLRIAYERLAVEKITSAKLEQIKDPERNRDVIDALYEWMAAGKPVDNLPRRNNGHPIKKITVRAEKKPTTERAGFEVNNGLVDNADMVRLDVFEKDNKFYLVPIYTHQVANRETWPEPPNRAITAHKTESEWTTIDNSFAFRFSLFPFSWIEAVTRKGEVSEGYYRGADRSTAAITFSQENSRAKTDRVGTKLLHTFKKFQVDRLGRKTEIKSEKRTWHGVVCT